MILERDMENERKRIYPERLTERTLDGVAELEKLLAHAKQLSVSDGGFYGVLGDNYLI